MVSDTYLIILSIVYHTPQEQVLKVLDQAMLPIINPGTCLGEVENFGFAGLNGTYCEHGVLVVLAFHTIGRNRKLKSFQFSQDLRTQVIMRGAEQT